MKRLPWRLSCRSRLPVIIPLSRSLYTPDPKPLGYPDETKREAVRLYLEGTSFRRIGRILSVNHQSVQAAQGTALVVGAKYLLALCFGVAIGLRAVTAHPSAV